MENTKEIAKEFEKVLKDVRSSYRFLYQYQKRLMDLVTFISNHLGFQFAEGEPHFHNNSLKSLKNIDPGKHWAWNSLQLYNYNFIHSAKTLGNWKDVMLMINIVSDTGFYDREALIQTRVEDFAPVEESKTQLHIILKTQGIEWKAYMGTQYIASSKKDEFVQNEDKDHLLIGKKYDLSRFIDETSTLAVLQDFEKFCHSNRVELVSDQGE